MDWLMIEGAHWLLALLPVLLLLGVFTWLDAFALMRPRELLLLLVLGGLGAVAAYPVSGRMLDTLPIGFSNYSRFIAPWIEEAIKGKRVDALAMVAVPVSQEAAGVVRAVSAATGRKFTVVPVEESEAIALRTPSLTEATITPGSLGGRPRRAGRLGGAPHFRPVDLPAVQEPLARAAREGRHSPPVLVDVGAVVGGQPAEVE